MNLISDLKSSIFGVDFRFFLILSEIQGQIIKKIIYQKLVGLKVYGVSYHMQHIMDLNGVSITQP